MVRSRENVEACDAEMAVRAWLDAFVLGLNLCPFAHAPMRADRVRLATTRAATLDGVLRTTRAEIRRLLATPAETTQTTIVIAMRTLADFRAYLHALGRLEDFIARAGLTGIVQLASFHPRYQFTGTRVGDVTNHTNRAPYPLFHILREDDVEAARLGGADVAAIPRRNMATLRSLGHSGVRALRKRAGIVDQRLR